MSDTTKSSNSSTVKISSMVLLIILVALILSLMTLVAAVFVFESDMLAAGYLLLLGALGIAFSAYVMFQTRRRLSLLRIETPQITTVVECRKCGFKSVREFQRGDYIFREVEPCQKCNDKMLITAIYREVKEKLKGTTAP